eukprot:5011415-Amphidinium_carterae.1
MAHDKYHAFKSRCRINHENLFVMQWLCNEIAMTSQNNCVTVALIANRVDVVLAAIASNSCSCAASVPSTRPRVERADDLLLVHIH